MNHRTLGQIAFEAYKAAVQSVAYDGTPIPEWRDLKPTIQVAWQTATEEIRDLVKIGAL